MKLYKIRAVLCDHAVSVFPAEEQELPPPEDLAGEPITRLIKEITLKGYTAHEARLAITAWAYHAKYDLHQGAVGVRVFCEQCARQIPLKDYPAEPIAWGLILLVAAIVAVALGLYVWAVLDPDINVMLGTHPWAYLLAYREQIWQGEIFVVSAEQRGVYERGGDLGISIESITRNVGARYRYDYISLISGRIVLKGRKPILYHVYRIKGFKVYFCGVLTEFATGLYRLREGGDDPYKPTGIWTRPGGRWGTPEYAGCWKKWWWF